MPYVLALDQGTTSSRAIVFDHDAAIVAVAAAFATLAPGYRIQALRGHR